MTTNEEQLLQRLDPIVARIARGLARIYRHEEYADLYQDGCLGALRAIRAFDRTRGAVLETFARPIIAGAIVNAVRGRDPLSRHARTLIRDAEAVRDRMEREGREVPTLDELAVKIRGLGGALLAARRAEPAFAGVEAGGARTIEPVTSVEDEPAHVAERRDEAARVRRAVANLSPRLKTVITGHYFGNQTTVQISRRMSITSQRVGQLRDDALARMRSELAGSR